MFLKLKDKEYRRLFIAGQIKTGLAFQIRALRNARSMTQKDLAELTSTKQTVISRIENKGAARLSIQTLLKLADAFDVALVVRFEPIDELIDWADRLSPKAMAPLPSEEILAALEAKTSKYAKQIWDTSELAPVQNFGIIRTQASIGPVQRTLPFDRPFLVYDSQTASASFVEEQPSLSAGYQTKTATR